MLKIQTLWMERNPLSELKGGEKRCQVGESHIYLIQERCKYHKLCLYVLDTELHTGKSLQI